MFLMFFGHLCFNSQSLCCWLKITMNQTNFGNKLLCSVTYDLEKPQNSFQQRKERRGLESPYCA